MKKILSLLLITVLIIGNSLPVFAEEGDPDEPEDPPVQNPEPDQVENPATVSQVNQISNQIQDLQISVNQINSVLSANNMENGNWGNITNFDRLDSTQLNYYYDHYPEFQTCWLYIDNSLFWTLPEDYISTTYSAEYLLIKSSKRYTLYNGNVVVQNSEITNYYYFDRVSDDPDYPGFFIVKDPQNNFKDLIPHKLEIVNNGLGDIENSVDVEPYLSTQIYYDGQYIRLEYDNSNDDFTGWYSLSGQLLSMDPIYSFNITSDTTLVLNYEFTSLDYTDQFNMLITILAGLLLATISKGELFNG